MGTFVVAMEAGVPAAIAIAGAPELNPKGRLEVRRGAIRVAVGAPLTPHDFSDKDALLREVRRRIIELHLGLGGLGGDAACRCGRSGATLPPSMSTRTDPPVVPAPNARARPPATLALRLRARSLELAESFRRSDRFFKMRLGIVAAWAVLSLATLWGACATPGPTNALGADVQVNGDSIMGVQLLVRNESDHIWEDVVLTVDDGWKFSQSTMRPRDLVVVSLSSFRRGDEAPPRDYRPRVLALSCAQGTGRFELR